MRGTLVGWRRLADAVGVLIVEQGIAQAGWAAGLVEVVKEVADAGRIKWIEIGRQGGG